jgi:hypothetical protein
LTRWSRRSLKPAAYWEASKMTRTAQDSYNIRCDGTHEDGSLCEANVNLTGDQARSRFPAAQGWACLDLRHVWIGTKESEKEYSPPPNDTEAEFIDLCPECWAKLRSVIGAILGFGADHECNSHE